MNTLKVCFVGIGSIAKRHIKNLSEICSLTGVKLSIDAFRSSQRKLDADIESYISQIFYHEFDLPANYDVIFITNPTDLHMTTLMKFHNNARHFFIEKPITSYRNLSAVTKFKFRDNSIYYVACPLRYSNIIQYLKNNIDPTKVMSVRCICSSYLPEWRPGIDYRKTYSAHSDLGGGVSIDLIHEWDYLQYLFGKPENIFCHLSKKSNLKIDCEDCALYIADYKDKIVELHLDYFGRSPIREIMLFMEDDTLIADLLNSKITYKKLGKTIEFFDDRNNFQKNEIRYFLNLLAENESKNFTFEAYNTMKLTQGVVE